VCLFTWQPAVTAVFEVYRLMFGTWHHFPLLDSV